MHDTALATGEAFFKIYGRDGCRILDVGGVDMNGSLRPFAPAHADYVGVDREEGPGVDVVNTDLFKLPFDDGDFDLVVSTSCIEHDPMFWVTFVEMARVTRPGGFIYISAPVNGPVHRHPVDCWRFYPDAAKALLSWAQHCGQSIELVESFLVPPREDVWIDFVSVFGKPPVPWRGRIRFAVATLSIHDR